MDTMHHHNPPAPEALPPAPGMFAGASPKFTFIMGIIVGVAAVSLVGFILAAGYIFKGDTTIARGGLGGNQPPVAAGNEQIPTAPSGPVDIALKDSDYIRGTKGAPVSIISYSDLECPFCQRFHPSLLRALQEYPNQVAVAFRHFPLSFHQNAQKEAEAAECVGKLGGAEKFWSFVDKIFERTTANGTGFALTNLGPLAKEVGVSQSQFQTCLDSGEMAVKVQTDLQEGQAYGVGGTPSTFVNGQIVEGAVPYEQLKAAIDQALSR